MTSSLFRRFSANPPACAESLGLCTGQGVQRRAERRLGRRTAALAAGLALAAAGLAGCSSSAKDDAKGAATDASAASESDTVTILTHDAFDLPEELIADFEAQSGYKLVTVPTDGGSVLGRLTLTKGKPNVDGVFGLDTYSVLQAVDEGVLDEYVSASLPESAARYDIDSHATPTDVGAVCVNADDAWFDEHGQAKPESFEDLAKPENAKLFVLQNPVESAPGLALLVGLASEYGKDGMLDYYTKLLDGGAKVNSGWSASYYTDFSGAEGKGEYPLVLSYSSSPAESEGATSILPSTCVKTAEYAGVVAGAKNPKGAQAFIDFLLSREVQEAFPTSMYMYPVDAEAALPEAWQTWAQLPEEGIQFDAREAADNREGWLKAWTEMFEAR